MTSPAVAITIAVLALLGRAFWSSVVLILLLRYKNDITAILKRVLEIHFPGGKVMIGPIQDASLNDRGALAGGEKISGIAASLQAGDAAANESAELRRVKNYGGANASVLEMIGAIDTKLWELHT